MEIQKNSRKDSKGKILPNNISQLKDGRYIWRKQINKRRYTLINKDIDILNKKVLLKEAQLLNGEVESLDELTLNEYFYKNIEFANRIKLVTKENYKNYWKWYIKDSEIGNLKLKQIKNIHITRVYNKLLEKISYSTLKYINSILNGILECALYDDKIIKDNPCKRVMNKMKKDVPKKREALSIKEQAEFIDYIASSKQYNKYLPLFSFLLGTGTRIGECLGITWNDIDFENNIIKIDHTLNYKSIDGKYKFFISKPKSNMSIREIPMILDLRKQLLMQKNICLKNTKNIDGYSDFVFTTKKGLPYMALAINRIIKKITKECGMKSFTVHTLRHTFCTRFCENESNIKIIQYVMGHSSINTTMNIYSHATMEKTKNIMAKLDDKIKIS